MTFVQNALFSGHLQQVCHQTNHINLTMNEHFFSSFQAVKQNSPLWVPLTKPLRE